MYQVFVSVRLDATGALEFRGVFRRRRHPVSQLLAVERSPTSVVFRFDRGSAMVLPAMLQGETLDALVAQLRELNLAVRRSGV